MEELAEGVAAQPVPLVVMLLALPTLAEKEEPNRQVVLGDPVVVQVLMVRRVIQTGDILVVMVLVWPRDQVAGLEALVWVWAETEAMDQQLPTTTLAVAVAVARGIMAEVGAKLE
jgi:hypothetical protein